MSNRKQARVGPFENNSQIIEIRPSRKLRIQHFNERVRDEKFEQEMQIYALYRQKHVISSGPLTVPKKKKNIQKNISQDNIGDQPKTAVSEHRMDYSKKHEENFKNAAIFDSKVSQLKLRGNEIQSTLSYFPSGEDDHPDLHTGLMTKSNETIPKTSEISHIQSTESAMHSKDLKPHGSSLNSHVHICGVETATSDSATDVDKDLVIFFIHGVGGSSDIWCSQTQYLSSLGYEIISPDLIGHGLSCTPKSAKAYHFNEIAADLETIFDKYCKRRNIIIGHSYGASFASYLARHRPKRVTKLILISGGPPTPLAPQPGVFKLPYFMLACIKPCLVLGFHKGAFHKAKTPVISKKEAFNIPAYVLQNIMNGQDWPDGDELFHGWLTCPCLLIYGADDQLVSLSDEQDMAKVIFDSQLEIINNASHMVMVEAPDEVNHIIETFIKKPLDSAASQS